MGVGRAISVILIDVGFLNVAVLDVVFTDV
jgi:hypothetical protein